MVDARMDSLGGRTSAARPSTVLLFVVVGALVLAAVAAASYAAGRRGGNQLHVRTGNAYVGLHQASVKVDGWAYGIVGSVEWVGADGTSHESGWPDCLGRPGTTERIRFGEISVTGPQDDSWRDVAWVDCRGAVQIGG
jgi:hypothetical protein